MAIFFFFLSFSWDSGQQEGSSVAVNNRRGTYALLSDLLAPDKRSSKTVDQLTQVLVKHYEPKLVIIAERFQFHRRNQAITETVTEYKAELQRLATQLCFW